MKKDNQTENLIQNFISKYADRFCEEEAEYVDFWNELLSVLNINNTSVKQKKIKCCYKGVKSTRKIDLYIQKTKVIIEQKSSNVALNEKCREIEDQKLDAYEQALFYRNKLKPSEQGRYIITCNFQSFRFYDLEKDSPETNFIEFNLKDLADNLSLFGILEDPNIQRIKQEEALSVKAGSQINQLYEALKTAYDSQFNENDANILCVRLIFCLFAEDAGLFEKDFFSNYFKQFPAQCIQDKLVKFFTLLNTKQNDREGKWFDEELLRLPYVNGGLFANAEQNVVPAFTEELKNLIFTTLSDENWEYISPTIFGSIFESTLGSKIRKEGGMHYTSICNIHKVIDPLFMDDLSLEFDEILDSNKKKDCFTAVESLRVFQEKLAKIKVLDPACGSGNFLTETYLSLRTLENEVLIAIKNQRFTDIYKRGSIIPLSNFYGMEINDYAQLVAKTALWIAEYQMFKKTCMVVELYPSFLPLKTNTSILHCNALDTDWNQFKEVDYIIGNPPFVGTSKQTKAQKDDVLRVFTKAWKNMGTLDYVACWYKKASDLMLENPKIKTALVSTNSICQGSQVDVLWTPLFNKGFHIDFAYKSFKWENDAQGQAQVTVIIVGFSLREKKHCTIYEKMIGLKAENINGYLMDYSNLAIKPRTKPLQETTSPILLGNTPVDDGNLILTENQYKDVCLHSPNEVKWIKKLVGAEELIYDKKRYCFWLKDVADSDLKNSSLLQEKLGKIRDFRLTSSKKLTRENANKPKIFQEIRVYNQKFLAIPEVSSENREYIPMGYFNDDYIPTNLVHVIPNATIYDFGIVNSIVHMIWMKTVCGRLGDGYRYSNSLVYNTFPWPEVTEEQKQKIEKTAQGILDIRLKYPNKTLADLYNKETMPEDLKKAHQKNDKAVIEAYGWSKNIKERDVLINLFQLYEQMIQDK